MAVTESPWIEPVTVQELKVFLHADDDMDDDLLAGFIIEAREYLERYTGRTLVPKEAEIAVFEGYNPLAVRDDEESEYAALYGSAQGYLQLPTLPIRAVTKLEYYDPYVLTNGGWTTQTSTEYATNLTVGRLYLLSVYVVPRVTQTTYRVTYNAGPHEVDEAHPNGGARDEVTQDLKNAIVRRAAWLYDSTAGGTGGSTSPDPGTSRRITL